MEVSQLGVDFLVLQNQLRTAVVQQEVFVVPLHEI